MNLERVLAEATDTLATRRFTRGKKKVKLGNGRKQALLRAVLHGFGRWCSEQPTPGEAPRLRLTARALYESRAALGVPGLEPAGASDALYDWSLLLREQQVLDVEDGDGIARVTLSIHHEKDSESFDLSVDIQRDTNGAHVYEPVLRAGSQLCDLRTVFPPAPDSADAPTLTPTKPTPDRERRIARLLEEAPRDNRRQLRDKLHSLSNPEFDRFERDFLQVHRIRPKWALWILIGIIGTPLGAYFGYRYYASLSVSRPAQFLMSERIEFLPDGTLVLPNVGIKTKSIENKSTGERIFIKPLGTGGFEFSYKESQHIFDGVSPQLVRQRLGNWLPDAYRPGIVILPLRELVDLIQADPQPPISPSFMLFYILPERDATLASELRTHAARCTVLFSRDGAAGPTMQLAPFDGGTQTDHLWGWVAAHEYPRVPGRYEIKARITRANGRVEYYTRILFIDNGGIPRIWAGDRPGLFTLQFPHERSIPLYAAFTYSDCCYVGEPFYLDLADYAQLLRRVTIKGVTAQRIFVVWEQTARSEEIPLQGAPDGTLTLGVPTHVYDSAGMKELHVSAEFGDKVYTTLARFEVKPARHH